MVKQTGGNRRKTRSLFRKNIKRRGKISLSSYFQKFKENDKVVLKAEPAVHNGMYFRRFHGKTGNIMRKRGTCYEIMIKDGGKRKIVIVHPVHLKRV